MATVTDWSSGLSEDRLGCCSRFCEVVWSSAHPHEPRDYANTSRKEFGSEATLRISKKSLNNCVEEGK
jgi:hypothetical protein